MSRTAVQSSTHLTKSPSLTWHAALLLWQFALSLLALSPFGRLSSAASYMVLASSNLPSRNMAFPRFFRSTAASMLDVAALGYCEQEFLLAGNATRYRHVEGTGRSPDGRWQAEPVDEACQGIDRER